MTDTTDEKKKPTRRVTTKKLEVVELTPKPKRKTVKKEKEGDNVVNIASAKPKPKLTLADDEAFKAALKDIAKVGKELEEKHPVLKKILASGAVGLTLAIVFGIPM